MIIEVLIASVAAIVITGTVAGLRFAERELHPEKDGEKEQREATALFERAVKANTLEMRNEVRALLYARPEAFSEKTRERVIQWLRNETVIISVDAPPAEPKAKK